MVSFILHTPEFAVTTYVAILSEIPWFGIETCGLEIVVPVIKFVGNQLYVCPLMVGLPILIIPPEHNAVSIPASAIGNG